MIYQIVQPAGSARGGLGKDWSWCPSHEQLRAKLGKWYPAVELSCGESSVSLGIQEIAILRNISCDIP